MSGNIYVVRQCGTDGSSVVENYAIKMSGIQVRSDVRQKLVAVVCVLIAALVVAFGTYFPLSDVLTLRFTPAPDTLVSVC